MPEDVGSPADLYRSRLVACRQEAARRRRQHVALGYARLLLAVAGVALLWFVFGRHAVAWEWIAVPWLGFAALAQVHATVLAAGARSERAAACCEHGMARVEDRWAGLRPRSSRVDASQSLYAGDLDVFGAASLFELLCAARTTAGEDALAGWLLAPADREQIRARQVAVAELRTQTGLREDVASLPGPEVVPVELGALTSWAEGQHAALPAVLGWVAPLLALFAVVGLLRWAVTHSPLLLVISLTVNVAVHYLSQQRLSSVFTQARAAASRLVPVAEVLGRVEAEAFTAPLLQELHGRLVAGDLRASASLRRLARMSEAIERRGALRLLDVPFLFSVQLGVRAQAWRRAHGRQVRPWLDALGEFEALLSLSAYHFEHPGDAFPEIIEAETTFAADDLGHPLLPEATCVRNSVALDEDTRLLLISGSNMSGKSTLLRSVGVAAVLGMAGAPVRARRVRMSSLRIGASIQVQDSLQSGRSRFFAEILRLRAITLLARAEPPVLFLLDELLAGTNSSDRVAGATGLVKDLLASGAIGLLSTHDLALTNVTNEASGAIRNAHFEDRIEADELAFDYTLREGIVVRSNGLALMRLIGLDV